MISLRLCAKCNLEYDEILSECPHCRADQNSTNEEDQNFSHRDKKISFKNTKPSNDFRLTMSGDAVQVDSQTAKLHPNFGLAGGILYFRFALLCSPLLGIAYTISQSSILFTANSFWVMYSCIFDVMLFIWVYWLSKQLFIFRRKTIDYIYKYLIVSAIIGILSAYMCSNLNNSIIISSSPLILVHLIKLTSFSVIAGCYLKLSKKIKITYLHIIDKSDPFFSEHREERRHQGK